MIKLMKFVLFCENANKFSSGFRKNFFTLPSTNRNNLVKRQSVLHSFTVNCQNIANSNQKFEVQRHDSVTQALIGLKYRRQIKIATRENGPILEKNKKLVAAIDSAKANNVPNDFIDYARDICLNFKTSAGIYEILHGSGVHFVIQYEHIDISLTKHLLLRICNKSDAIAVLDEIKWHQNFTQKGVITLRNTAIADNDIHDVIAKCGAETAKKEPDEEGMELWKFYCNPSSLHKVKKYLQNIDSVEEAYVGYIPKNIIVPSPLAKKNIFNMILELCQLPQIDRLFINME